MRSPVLRGLDLLQSVSKATTLIHDHCDHDCSGESWASCQRKSSDFSRKSLCPERPPNFHAPSLHPALENGSRRLKRASAQRQFAHRGCGVRGRPEALAHARRGGARGTTRDKDGRSSSGSRSFVPRTGSQTRSSTNSTRSATTSPACARAEHVRVLTVGRKVFLRRIQKYPPLAFRIVEKRSGRIRELNAELVRPKAVD